MKISCAFPTTMSSPDDVRTAEDVGYERAWLFDTPQQSIDVWMALALAAERTSRIGLGPGVLVPTLRHPMVNAAATAALVGMAPGRVAVAFGTGFTGRRAMGYPPIPWAYMEAYLHAYRGLLRGDVIEWEGARMQMLHPDTSAPPRPIDVPVLIGAVGPKGRAVAHRHDGIFVGGVLDGLEPGAFPWVAYSCSGTVLEPDEGPSSDRVQATAGPAGALVHHGTYEVFGADRVRQLPGGSEWLAVIEQRPENERHLAVHTGHLMRLNDADKAAWAVTQGSLLLSTTLTGPPGELKARIAQLAEHGVTEIVYQPTGPNVRRELEAMFAVVREAV